ncbi:MAG TPA: roadblock/LC7 domain-containing protein [Burkholderiales bacterium]|nr:roadblock/LC7 domain-containing protein [Burkholderiales bacterium]
MTPARDGIGSLSETDAAQLTSLLANFVGETQADCAVLCDRSGRLLTLSGDLGAMDQTAFASLVAGDFAASDQLARLLGEDEFSSLYHAGLGRSMYLADVSGYGILAALFNGATTLGMIRLKSRTTVPRLVELFEQIASRSPADSGMGMDENWMSEAEDEIDRLFGEN